MKKKAGITITAMVLTIAMMAAPVSAGRGNFICGIFDRWKLVVSQLFGRGGEEAADEEKEPAGAEVALDSNVISNNSRVMKLSWTAAECDYYEIQRDTRVDFATADTKTTQNTEYMFCTFGPSYYHYPAHLTYYFRVRPVTGEVPGDWSDTVIAPGTTEESQE